MVGNTSMQTTLATKPREVAKNDQRLRRLVIEFKQRDFSHQQKGKGCGYAALFRLA